MKCIQCGKPRGDDASYCEACRGTAEEIRTFVGKNDGYYEQAWSKERGFTWNMGAFFFQVVWLGYRKLYAGVLIFLLALIAAHALAYATGWNYALPIINITIPALLVVLAAMVILGRFGNQLYGGHVRRAVSRIRMRHSSDSAGRLLRLRRAGGTSKLGIVLVVCASAAAHFASHALFPTNIDVVQTVRGGVLYNYPLYEIGDAFEEYFEDPVWTYDGKVDGMHIVEFSGTAGQQQVHLQFFVDYGVKEIEPYRLQVDGKTQSEAQFTELMDAVFHVKTPFELNDQLEQDTNKQAL